MWKHTVNAIKPHIVFILTKLELGGAQKICLTLMKGLVEKGYTCSLISGSEGPLVQETQQFSSVFLLDDFKREIGLNFIIQESKTFKQIIQILKHLKQQHPNLIIHTHSTKAGILGRWAAFFAGIKNRIHTVHGYGFHAAQNNFAWLATYILECMTAPISTHFICVSNTDAKTGMKLLPGFKKKYSIMRAAVDTRAFASSIRSQTSEQQTVVIGSVSCFKPQKNLLDLLRAFCHVYTIAKNYGINVKLEIIGDGTQRELLEAWIDSHSLSSAITLYGWQNNVASIMQSWDVYAMSSLWEGLPCAIIEARLCALPVVCYNVGGIAEVIIDGQNGFLLTPHDWQGLAEKLLLLVTMPMLRLSLSYFPDNLSAFEISTMVDSHIRLYETLASKSTHQ